MPHVSIKMIEGRTEEQKQALAAVVTQTLIATLGCSDASVSVVIEDFADKDWTDAVYIPDIQGHAETIYKKPGYDPFE
ncbi:4-oxalocrotonate tautomerase [Pararhizobium capsulatum DSM 1112]|uniref:4-oxalocrotonate tautomerase n=1 Tax=Pararhizobium capsulatum DSM 1112 TaxID=1121113 RepID=A0ABU0BV66_9HYPH|nr:tautomerase family protein [Pararhizobium capsulatum]MDQ0321576.1 4-oxalocrotonate tautomerase [Pararhizobium capsulatum DSM 1112]